MTDGVWLNTVRIARDIGDISSLFPPGITGVVDLPYTLHEAIRMALTFLSFEQLPSDEQPPKKIWLDGDRMEAHWSAVTQAREDKAKGRGDLNSMPKNDLVKSMLVG